MKRTLKFLGLATAVMTLHLLSAQRACGQH